MPIGVVSRTVLDLRVPLPLEGAMPFTEGVLDFVCPFTEGATDLIDGSRDARVARAD